MSPLSPNTKLRIHRPDGIFSPGLVSVNFVFGDRGQALVIVGKNKMCLRYSMHRTSPVLKTKTRQIGSDKKQTQYNGTIHTNTDSRMCNTVNMHVDMGGMVCGVDSAPQAFIPILESYPGMVCGVDSNPLKQYTINSYFDITNYVSWDSVREGCTSLGTSLEHLLRLLEKHIPFTTF